MTTRRSSRWSIAVASWLAVIPVLGLTPAVARAATPMYPNLQMARLSGFTIGSDPALPGRRLLRFNAIIVNTGPAGAAFEVVGSRPDTSATSMTVSQVVHNSDGSTTSIAVPGASMIYDTGDGHHHWHLRDLEAYTLQTPSGRTLTSPKVGFCFYDNYRFNLGLPGAPQGAVYTNCGTTTSLTVRTGLSVGWGDEYAATVHNQWVDITDEPSGQYHLTAVADPRGYFGEQNNSDNTTWVDLRIKGGSVKVLRYGPSA
jgi:hypothetical protein